MELSKQRRRDSEKREIFRVIDDGIRLITTDDPYKALVALQRLIEKHNVTTGNKMSRCAVCIDGSLLKESIDFCGINVIITFELKTCSYCMGRGYTTGD